MFLWTWAACSLPSGIPRCVLRCQSFENESKPIKHILPPGLGGGRSALFGSEGVQAEVRAASLLKDILKWGAVVVGSTLAFPPLPP